uniref:Uncharacterized protein n=1 Tax=Anguilla anguilla TaxID=7936 RepID=A0A0E9W894_ANGAN
MYSVLRTPRRKRKNWSLYQCSQRSCNGIFLVPLCGVQITYSSTWQTDPADMGHIHVFVLD